MNIRKILIDGFGLDRFGERFVNVSIILIAISGVAAWWFCIDEYERLTAGYIVFCVVAIATLYTLSPQITWAHNMRNPPPLNAAGIRILNAHCPYFKGLAITEKKRFASRVAMFLNDKEFISEGTPEEDADLPEDIKVAIAACVIQFTFGLDEFWLPDLEKIICYPRLFPTVERNEFHAGEAHDDGCIILSALMMREGLTKPVEFYHIGLHTAVEYWLFSNKGVSLEGVWQKDADSLDDLLAKFCKIRQFRENYWMPLTGTNEVNLMCVATEAFFTQPQRMSEMLPTVFNFLLETLNQDPRKDTYRLLRPVANW